MRKNKKQRKKIKAIRLRNKKLIKRYPWLRAIDWWWKPIKTYDFTLLDDMPEGWRKCFGMMMVEDIDKALKGHNIRIQQIKEKYGQLRIYFSAHKDIYKDVDRVIEAYSHLSENICIGCGKPDVGYTSGWIMPICLKCFCRDGYHTEEEYYEQISPHNRMALDYSYSRHEPGIKGWTKYTVDISEYTNKVRVNWWKKHNAKLS